MKKVLLLMSLIGIFTAKAQSNTVTLDEQFNTSGISNSAPAYQPVKEPTQPKQSVFPDWVNKIKEPAISEDIRPEIREVIREVKYKSTLKESDKVQEVIDEMFPNKSSVPYQAPVVQPINTVEQNPIAPVSKYQKSQKSFDIDELLNVFIPLIIGMILFFVWANSKSKINTSLPIQKDNQLSYSQRVDRLKETLIESAKQTLVLDLREMEIKGILDNREIAVKALLRVYEEISMDQIEEYSKVSNISKVEVGKIIKSIYQILQTQYYSFFNNAV
ncbi:hypothetical protein [Chryseobacterium aureum]|uniref:hypothetical protein n=1 Tax=Chryseobacterium aureum TaxID=2497456 RepID=UPI000F864F56|nr:hypothetical protein [Chryseobacterium aureum]